MTEAEWLASINPFPLLRCRPGSGVERKHVLLVCAGWRQIEPLLPEEQNRQAIDALERLTDGPGPADPGEVTWRALQIEQPIWPRVWDEQGNFQPVWDADAAALAATVLFCTAALGGADASWASEAEAERASVRVKKDGAAVAAAWNGRLAGLSSLVRDICGNPFYPPCLDPRWLLWNDSTIPKIARRIYDDRDFALLPILGDALQEAGCNDLDILAHCRGPGPHVRGCWVVDVLLGKE